MFPRYTQSLSALIWNGVSTGANTTSTAFLDTFNCPFVSAFGHVSGATTITLMVSQDGSTWRAGPTQVLAGAADFCINAEIGAEFVALQSTNSVTATAVISAK